MSIKEFAELFAALVGVAAFVPAVIGLLRATSDRFGFPPDFEGYSRFVEVGINLLLFVLFVIANVLGFNVAPIDAILNSGAAVLVAITALIGLLVVPNAVTAVSHGIGRKLRIPLFGYARD